MALRWSASIRERCGHIAPLEQRGLSTRVKREAISFPLATDRKRAYN